MVNKIALAINERLMEMVIRFGLNFIHCNISVSVVPVQFDLTNYKLKSELEKNWDIL